MATNPYYNKVVYGNTTLIDLTADDVTAADVAAGKKFHLPSGEQAIGAATGGGAITVTTETDSGGGTITNIIAVDISQDTVTSADVVSGKTFHLANGDAATGSIPTVGATTITPTTSTQTAIAAGRYTTGAVQVAPIPSQYIIPTGTTNITENGTVDVTQYASASVNVQSNNQNKTVSPATTTQTYTADSGYTGLGAVTVNAMPTGTLGTPSITVSNTGLITAKATVQTAGYLATTVSSTNTSQLTTKAATTITPTTATQTAINANVYTTGAIKVGPMPSGALSAPTITVSAAGLITAKATVGTAGYLATTASTTSTSQLSVKAAQTYTPSTQTQTITAGQYLTGAQTILGDADLVGSNIISTANIFGVQGTVVIQHYYTGSSAPTSGLGANGDIYLQTS